MDYILVAENDSESPVEFPLEEDGTVLLSTIVVQYPGATGLKFTNPQSGASRVIRLTDDKLFPPERDGWGNRTYFCVFPKETKRKFDDDDEEFERKVQKITPRCTDLIVLGLPWDTTDATLREYFEKEIGPVALVQVKKTPQGSSRGFGFVRFNDYEMQKKALLKRHYIDGRWCDVNLPPSSRAGSSKVFVGQLTTDINETDLRNFFSKLGDVTDVFIPKPFRGFGFVTFLDPEVAAKVSKMDDVLINNTTVHTETATPKSVPSQSSSSQDLLRRGVRDTGYSRGGNGYNEDWDYDRGDRYGNASMMGNSRSWNQGDYSQNSYQGPREDLGYATRRPYAGPGPASGSSEDNYQDYSRAGSNSKWGFNYSNEDSMVQTDDAPWWNDKLARMEASKEKARDAMRRCKNRRARFFLHNAYMKKKNRFYKKIEQEKRKELRGFLDVDKSDTFFVNSLDLCDFAM